jgi:SAM-dependent methyltransferase
MNDAEQDLRFFEPMDRHALSDSGESLQNHEQSGVDRASCPVCQALCRDTGQANLTCCLACKHLFQTDLAVTVSYDANYAHQYDSRPVTEMSNLRWNFIDSALHLPKGSRVLDIGYGNGAFLKRARSAGMEIYGIDLHTEDFGIPVVDFETKLSFDLICFFDSIEHFPNFAPLARLKARNIVVSIPETPDFILRAPRQWRHYKPGEHLHYFSHASLDLLMNNWGFSEKAAQGYPEDRIRGKLSIEGKTYDNIYTAIYTSNRQYGSHTA